MRTLVAAFGNELRGDDGFGIAVLRELESSPPAPPTGTEVRLVEVGTGGIWLAQELLSRWDRLVIVDAMTRGSAPGTLYVVKIDDVVAATEVDMHLAVPSSALGVAKALGALPRDTYLVGCEPACVEELTLSLSGVVAAAVELAAQHVRTLVERPS